MIIVLIKNEKGKAPKHHLVFVLEKTLPSRVIRKQILGILDFYEDEAWKTRIAGEFPVVLIICPTKQVLISSKRMTRSILEDQELLEDLSFRFALAEEVQRDGVTAKVWETI